MLVACAVVVVIGTVVARGVAAWTMRSYSIAVASRDAGHIATILAQRTAQSLQAIDGPLAALQRQFAEQDTPAGGLRAGAGGPHFSEAVGHLPPGTGLAIADAQGHVVDHTPSWSDANGEVSGREFFAAQAARDEGLHIGTSRAQPNAAERTLYLSRRLQSRQGDFLGIAVARASADDLARTYRTIAAMDDVSFALVRADGTVLLNAPYLPDQEPANQAGEKLPPQSPWYAAAAQGGGFYQADADANRPARFVAVAAVPGYPLLVDAGEPESIVLAPWQRLAAMIAAATALSLVCFGFLLRALYIQFRRLAAAQTSLADREGELRRQSQELARANTQIDAALNNMSQGLCMFDKVGQLVIRNERYLRIYGVAADAIKPGTPFVDALKYQQTADNFDGDLKSFAADLQSRLAQGQIVNSTHRLADGRTIEVTSEPMIGGGWVATHDDITERQRSEARIAHMARYDSLTDLANRVLFRERVDAALERYGATGIGYSIFIFDLDLFKAVNDSLGHPVGDALLKAVAMRLQNLAGEADTVGRIGGDEFAILHEAAGDARADATRLADRLLEVIGAPYEIDGHRIVIGTSIGIAMAPDHGLDNERLLKNADLALYRAKSDGRNSYRFFEHEMDRELRLRRALEVDLHRAVENEEFEAHYQPLVGADDGETCAVEALIRWRHPSQGLVPPGRFIPVAEERGLVGALDRWMLRRACADATAWPEHIRVAVNVSPTEFRNGELLEMIADALARSGLPPSRLEIEITESVLLQKSERNIAILHQIKKLDVSIVLDDFGTGYSSLGYLRLFPFDKIKIDQTFVREMPYRTDCAAIVCAIANLGRELGIVTVAEGVETAEQLDLVRAAGCMMAQGYLFARPCAAAELEVAQGWAARARRTAAM
jgi:diguanylate cyclase (GGDEF)-like protein